MNSNSLTGTSPGVVAESAAREIAKLTGRELPPELVAQATEVIVGYVVSIVDGWAAAKKAGADRAALLKSDEDVLAAMARAAMKETP